MTLKSTTIAAESVPQARLWGIGRDNPDGKPADFPISWADCERDIQWASGILAQHGVGAGTPVLIVAGMAGVPLVRPVRGRGAAAGWPLLTRRGRQLRGVPQRDVRPTPWHRDGVRPRPRGRRGPQGRAGRRVQGCAHDPRPAGHRADRARGRPLGTHGQPRGTGARRRVPARRGRSCQRCGVGGRVVRARSPSDHRRAARTPPSTGREPACGAASSPSRVRADAPIRASLSRPTEESEPCPYAACRSATSCRARRRYGDRVAFVDGERRLTWAQADDRVNRLANALAGVGVGLRRPDPLAGPELLPGLRVARRGGQARRDGVPGVLALGGRRRWPSRSTTSTRR